MGLAVGLTGGIGSGKTTVAGLFASLGAGIVDTDEISRRLTGPAQPAIDEIARKFGPRYIAPDGGLDRTRMRELIFVDTAARKRLETILHPLIREESTRQIDASTAPYVIVVVPLLIETGAYRGAMSRILVVDCEPETQIRRVIERSGLSQNEVLAIMDSQVSRQQRLREADDVIHNDSGLETLQEQVNPLHLRYIGLAAIG